jgi:FAD/FMN-containing dehydrogenase
MELAAVSDNDLILPPDVDVKTLRTALEEISAVVGGGNLQAVTLATLRDDARGSYFDLPLEHDMFYAKEKDEFIASAVAAPGSTEETAAIVKVANKYLVPLWPISRGRNLGECDP